MAMDDLVRKVRTKGVLGGAIVSRDGTVLAAEMPPGVSKETFSIMCATIYGASMTVSNELKRSYPRQIVLESRDGRVVIAEAGKRALLVIVLGADADLDHVLKQALPILDAIDREAS